MALSGYAPLYNTRRNGGIQKLALIQTSDLVETQYDAESRGYTNITLQLSQKFSVYNFREDEAEYTEKTEIQQGVVVVTHELKFLLDKMCNTTAIAVSELINSSFRGLIALIRTFTNETYLIGYSQEFEKQRPLHVVQTNATTGKRFTDPSSEIIVLQSTDTAKACNVFMDIDELLNN